MKAKILLLFLLSVVLVSNAQTLSGLVLDSETNMPLEGVHVYTKDKNQIELTNKKGVFILKIESEIEEKDLVYFSFLGYNIDSIPYTKARKEYKVYLKKEVNSLEEVTIYAQKELKHSVNYEELNPMPDAVYSFGSVLVDNKIYAIGGDASFIIDGLKKAQYNDPAEENFLKLAQKAQINYSKETFKSTLNIYDLSTDTWTTSKTVFKERAYHTLNYNKNEGKIYVIGGKNMSKKKNLQYLDNQIEIYDLKNKSIKIDDTNPHAGVNSDSFLFEDNIIVMGGSTKIFNNGRINYSKKVHFYNTTSGFWYELQDMPIAKEIKGELVGNSIYVFGGFNNKKHTKIDSYDLVSGKWSHIGSMKTNLKNPSITHSGKEIFLFENKTIFVYNIATNELKEFSIDLEMIASEMQFYNQKLYIIGGYIANEYSIKPSKKVYSINLSEFETTRIKEVTGL